MKITKIEAFQIETPRYYRHVSGHVIVKVKKRIRSEASYLYPPEGPELGIELDAGKLKVLTLTSA